MTFAAAQAAWDAARDPRCEAAEFDPDVCFFVRDREADDVACEGDVGISFSEGPMPRAVAEAWKATHPAPAGRAWEVVEDVEAAERAQAEWGAR